MVCSKTFQRRQRISWINFDSNEERHLHKPQQNNNRDSIHNLCKWSFDLYTFRHTLFPFMWYMYHSKLNIIYINLHKICNCGKMSQQIAKWSQEKKYHYLMNWSKSTNFGEDHQKRSSFSNIVMSGTVLHVIQKRFWSFTLMV